jgi:LacI family transcriptional regulator
VASELGFEYVGDTPHRKTSTILLVIYKSHGQVVGETQFFETLTKGISDATYRYGYHRLSISYFYAQEHPSEQLKALASIKCAGIILLATEMHSKDIAQFTRLGVPVVLLDSWFPTKNLDAIVIDNMCGAWEAVRYLHAMGHTDIGYLSSKVGIRNFLERRQGYLAAMADIGQSDDPTSHKIVRVGPAAEEACMDMLAYLSTHPKLPTAFFADNDLIAIGCMRALEDNGIRVPDDISIIGFDNVSTSMLTNPPLTTMEVPKESMGALAVRRLIELIKDQAGGETVRISVQPRIVERMSVARSGGSVRSQD